MACFPAVAVAAVLAIAASAIRADAAAEKTEGFKAHYSNAGAATMVVDFVYTPEADE